MFTKLQLLAFKIIYGHDLFSHSISSVSNNRTIGAKNQTVNTAGIKTVDVRMKIDYSRRAEPSKLRNYFLRENGQPHETAEREGREEIFY